MSHAHSCTANLCAYGAQIQGHRAQLMRASSEGHREKVEVLLAGGAAVNVKDKASRGEGCAYGARMP